MPKILEDEKIYQAVMKVIAEYGYAGATTKMMAKAADVSEVTLFRKYESKAQLVKQSIITIIAQTDYNAATQYSGNLSADLRSIVQAYQDTAVKHGQFIFMLISEIPRYPELASILDTPLGIFSNIGALLGKYQAEGKLKQEHPMHAMSTLLAPLMYLSMMQSAMPEMNVPPLDIESHIASFLEGRRIK